MHTNAMNVWTTVSCSNGLKGLECSGPSRGECDCGTCKCFVQEEHLRTVCHNFLVYAVTFVAPGSQMKGSVPGIILVPAITLSILLTLAQYIYCTCAICVNILYIHCTICIMLCKLNCSLATNWLTHSFRRYAGNTLSACLYCCKAAPLPVQY